MRWNSSGVSYRQESQQSQQVDGFACWTTKKRWEKGRLAGAKTAIFSQRTGITSSTGKEANEVGGGGRTGPTSADGGKMLFRKWKGRFGGKRCWECWEF